MKSILILLASVGLCVPALATVRYVNAGNASPISPYTNWTSAAITIQEAIDIADVGDLVLVADGNYAAGNTNVSGANRVAITKAVRVQSVNGPEVTQITGKFQNPAIRCAYVGSGAVLSGFTLTDGRSVVDGGGAYCDGGVLTNCVLTGNTALRNGGGVAGGSLYNCLISGNAAPGFQNIKGNGGGCFGSIAYNCRVSGNTAQSTGGGVRDSVLYNCLVDGNACFSTNLFIFGGGAAFSTLVSCTVAGNHTSTLSDTGGGTYFCTVSNSIVYYNSPENNTASSVAFTCTTPLPAEGVGNFSNEPFFSNDYRLLSNSPCINAGDNSMAVGTSDLAGDARVVGGYLDLGAFEFQSAPFPSAYAIANYTNLLPAFAASFSAGYHWGRATNAIWDFADGTVVSNTLAPTHAWSSVGSYPVVAHVFAPNIPVSLSATVTVHVATQIVYYVNAAGNNPIPPYSSWQTAATNIQDAVDVATPARGSLVLVSNGTYQFGGRAVFGALTNRLAVTKPITLQSVSGPEATVIRGNRLIGSIYGDSAVRCVYLTNSASLIGFTITGGATRMVGDSEKEQSGGGIWCESTNANIVDCTITENSARIAGGGVFRGNLTNCRLTNNRAEHNSGGGAKLARLDHCMLLDNSAGFNGGGADQCTLDVCAVSRNYAIVNGGGANDSRVRHSTFVSNSAGSAGGGISGSALTNCVVYYNTARISPNHLGSVFSYCCTLPIASGIGNITSEPQLTDGIHIASNSPCISAGNSGSGHISDLDGEAWSIPPAMGCDEYIPGAVTGPLEVTVRSAFTNVATGFTQNFVGVITGRATFTVWNFGGEFFTNQPSVARAYAIDGTYPVTLTAFNDDHASGVAATALVHVVTQPIHYASLESPNPVAPYLSWDTAATNIQDAVDAAFGASVVLVSNGVYQVGGRIGFGFLTNRLIVDKNITVRSANGPEATVIKGNPIIGDNAVRCVALSQGAILTGFTLTDGATRNSGDAIKEQSGGGIWCESTNAMALGCVIMSNSAAQLGGGAYSGSLSNSTLMGNRAGTGGGASASFQRLCTIATNTAQNGGGVSSNVLIGCSVLGNTANSSGGGAYGSILQECLVAWNTNSGSGGGTINSSLDNCLIQYNSARTGGGIFGGIASNSVFVGNLATGPSGGGAVYQAIVHNSTLNANRSSSGPGGGGASSTFNNCLITSNSSGTTVTGVYVSSMNNCTAVGHTTGYAVLGGVHQNCIVYHNAANVSAGTVSYCCIVPLVAGIGNFTNNPVFVNAAVGDFRLQSNSPCINAGRNAYVTNATDLAGHPRISAGTVDLGAYEFPAPDRSAFDSWLQSFGLPGGGPADYLDSDGDGANNWQEWVTDTIPTNAASALRIVSVTRNGFGAVVTWTSVSGVPYALQRSVNLGANPVFITLATNLPGQPGMTSFTDTNAPVAGPCFYRVSVANSTNQIAFSVISFAWLQQYGLPTDGTADYADTDHDGMNTWAEWRAGSVPTNAASLLRMLSLTGGVSGVTVRWQSVSNKLYWLERATNLGLTNSFALRATSLPSQGATTSFTDPAATNSAQWFYRVGVQE